MYHFVSGTQTVQVLVPRTSHTAITYLSLLTICNCWSAIIMCLWCMVSRIYVTQSCNMDTHTRLLAITLRSPRPARSPLLHLIKAVALSGISFILSALPCLLCSAPASSGSQLWVDEKFDAWAGTVYSTVTVMPLQRMRALHVACIAVMYMCRYVCGPDLTSYSLI